jgi:hypothetical protein
MLCSFFPLLFNICIRRSSETFVQYYIDLMESWCSTLSTGFQASPFKVASIGFLLLIHLCTNIMPHALFHTVKGRSYGREHHGGELLKNQCQKCEPRSMMSMNIIVHVAMIQCPTTVAGVWSSTTRSTTVRWHTSAARAVVQRPATTSPTRRWSSCVTS